VLRVLFTDGGVVDGAEEDGFARLQPSVLALIEVGGLGSSCTAYAIRSPLGSDERGVGCPRVVEGEAAQIASVCVSLGHGGGGGGGGERGSFYLRQET
jgi:hypothetical protein